MAAGGNTTTRACTWLPALGSGAQAGACSTSFGETGTRRQTNCRSDYLAPRAAARWRAAGEGPAGAEGEGGREGGREGGMRASGSVGGGGGIGPPPQI